MRTEVEVSAYGHMSESSGTIKPLKKAFYAAMRVTACSLRTVAHIGSDIRILADLTSRIREKRAVVP